MAAAALGVEPSRTSELGADDDERLVEHLGALEVFDQAGEGVIELADEHMLVVDALVMHVPAGAVDEVEVVRDFDEAHAALDEPSGEQAALPEFAAVGGAHGGRLLLEVEVAHEGRARQAEGFLLRGRVFLDGRAAGGRLTEGFEQGQPCVLAVGRDLGRGRETVRAGLGVDEVDIAVLDAEEAGAAAHVRVTDEHVGRDGRVGGAAAVRDDGADGRVDGVAADHAAGVHEVRGERMLVDDLMVDRADRGHVLHQLRRAGEVLAEAYAGDGGLDGRVERAGFLLRGLVVAEDLRVERVGLAHATAEPDEDAVLGLALGAGRAGVGQERRGGERREAEGGDEGAAVHRISSRGIREN